MSNLILCGLKSAGKTTFGKKLAMLLGKSFIDTDALLGCARELYQTLGEKTFREKERNLVQQLDVKNHVIALGGGTLLLEENRRHLRALGTIVYIHMQKEEWLKRVAKCDSPILAPSKEDYYNTRINIYREAAHIEIKYGI